MKNSYLQIFSTVKPIKGFVRSIIYDLVKEKYTFISNPLFEFIISYDGRQIEILGDLEREMLSTIIENKWGFLCEEYELAFFPTLNLEWKRPYKINNAIILFDGNNVNNLKHVITGLSNDTILCKFITIISFRQLPNWIHNAIMDVVDFYQHVTFDFYLHFYDSYIDSIFSKCRNIKNILFFNSFKNEQTESVIHTTKPLEYNFISPSYFNCNIKIYTESNFHNLYYNDKIIIDENNFVINSLYSKKEVAIYDIDNIYNIIEILREVNLWDISKDKVDVCMHCEFRYMCSDMCEIIKRDDNTYFRSKECEYNPYIAKWSFEDEFFTLEECNITCNTTTSILDLGKINEIIEHLYY